jgi:hypothetical protein
MPPTHYCAIAFCPFILVLQLGCAKATQDNDAESTRPPGLIRLAKRPAVPSQAVFEVDLPQAVADGLANSEALETTDWEQVFHIHADAAEGLGWRELPPVQGSYRLTNNRLVFEPLFPLQAGVNYHAVFEPAKAVRPPAGTSFDVIETILRIEKPKAKPGTIVSQVYPTANSLPENLLKFYLHFSAPMSQGKVYSHIHLLNARNEKIDLPFLELDEELWNPDGTRLTILFDPGRIKSGLLPREQDGPVLREGNSYTLKIDTTWPDAAGAPLKQGFTKKFIVAAPDVGMPSPARWKMTAPEAGSINPMTLDFPEPLDHALLQRLLWIEDAGKHAVEGQVQVGNVERQWAFVPNQAWKDGDYRVVIGTGLEDLAGNSVARPFEVDRVQRPDDEFVPDYVTLEFKIGN